MGLLRLFTRVTQDEINAKKFELLTKAAKKIKSEALEIYAEATMSAASHDKLSTALDLRAKKARALSDRIAEALKD